MAGKSVSLFLAASALGLAAPAWGQLVPAGQQVQLTAEYEYVSEGARKDKYDAQEWKVRRFAVVTATLQADQPASLPVMHKIEDKQQRELDERQAAMERASKKMQPAMADMMAVAEKCGDDDACLEREVQAYATQNRDALNQTREAVAPDAATAARQGPERYQFWRATGRQQGRYDVAEEVRMVDADPICQSHAGARCRREEGRVGGGEIPMPPGIGPKDPSRAGASMFEVDSGAKSIALALPLPIMPLPVKETVATDHPEQKSGESARMIPFPASGAVKPITVALKGTALEQSGVYTIRIKGASDNQRTLEKTAPEDGVLTVRWHVKPL